MCSRSDCCGLSRAVAAHPESGFTLIELLVGMVLLIILLAVAMIPILDGFSGAAKNQSSAMSEQAVRDAVDSIRNDVAAASAPDRDPRKVREIWQLHKAMVSTAPVISADPADGGAILNVYDVLVATPTDLQFQADVLKGAANAGAECVRYTTSASGADPFWIRRRVYADALPAASLPNVTCTGAVAKDDYVIERSKFIAGRTPTQVFSYDLLCSSDPVSGCGGASSEPASCSTWSSGAAAVTGVRRNWIVSVNVNIGATTQRQDAVSERSDSTNMSVRSRETSEYRRALGCG